MYVFREAHPPKRQDKWKGLVERSDHAMLLSSALDVPRYDLRMGRLIGEGVCYILNNVR